MDPVSIGLAGAGLVGGFMGNQSAAHEAAKWRRLVEGNTERQRAAFDQFNAWLNNAIADGQFDPEKAIGQITDDMDRHHAIDQKNMAASERLLGYGPGDSVAQQQLRANDLGYQQQLNTMRLGQRRQALMDLMGAYDQVANASGVLNGGIQAGIQQQQMAMSQMQSPAQMLGAVMPFLASNKAPSGASTSSNPNPFNLPNGGAVRYQSPFYNTTPTTIGGSGTWNQLSLAPPSLTSYGNSGVSYGGVVKKPWER